MDEWNKRQHTASGLLDRMREVGVGEREAEATTLAFLERHVEKKRSPLCGNTIWQDRRFLARYMPTLEAYLHYRMIDVSSIKDLEYLDEIRPIDKGTFRNHGAERLRSRASDRCRGRGNHAVDGDRQLVHGHWVRGQQRSFDPRREKVGLHIHT